MILLSYQWFVVFPLYSVGIADGTYLKIYREVVCLQVIDFLEVYRVREDRVHPKRFRTYIVSHRLQTSHLYGYSGQTLYQSFVCHHRRIRSR